MQGMHRNNNKGCGLDRKSDSRQRVCNKRQMGKAGNAKAHRNCLSANQAS